MLPKKRIFARFVVAFLFFAAMTAAPGAGQADSNPASPANGDLPAVNSIDKAGPNGVFEVQILCRDRWQDAGSLSYDRFFLERTIDIGPFLEVGTQNDDQSTGGRSEAAGKETVRIRLLQKGGGAAHIDSVLLGGRPAGEARTGSATLPDPAGESWAAISRVQQKLSRNDFDVVDAFGETFELTFPAPETDRILRMVARVEGMTISTTPFQFPRENLYRPMNLQSRF